MLTGGRVSGCLGGGEGGLRLGREEEGGEVRDLRLLFLGEWEVALVGDVEGLVGGGMRRGRV